MKIRLDQYLVQNGLVQSRERAKALIMAGVVFVNQQKVDKAGEMIKEDAVVEVRGHDIGYVSRGGLKLEKAMKCFPLTPDGKVCMDIGASTGGFTDCMLAGGSWCMPADMLRAVRQSVCDRIDEYRAIVEDPAFKEYFPVVGESHLKTVPKGFPKDFPYPQYIRCKDFTVACRVEDEFFSRPDFMERIIDVFRQLKRFADFTNETIDEFE